MTKLKRWTEGDDTGLGLIEVVVALLVSSIVLGAVGTILINSWIAQREVTNMTQATNRGQLIASAIERAVRNAEVLQVTDGGQILRVQTTLDGGLKCQGFRLVPDAPAQMSMSASTLGAATGWPSWEEGPRQRTAAGGGAVPFFTAWTDDTGVTYSFDIVEGDTAPVTFAGDVGKRNLPAGETVTCW